MTRVRSRGKLKGEGTLVTSRSHHAAGAAFRTRPLSLATELCLTALHDSL